MWFRKGGGGLKLDTWRYRLHWAYNPVLAVPWGANSSPIYPDEESTDEEVNLIGVLI